MSGKIQNEDIKSSAELVAAGGAASQLPNDDKIYVTASGLNKTLKAAIEAGNIGSAGFTVAEVSSNITLAKSTSYHVDTSAVRTLALPVSPAAGDSVRLVDKTGSAATNPISLTSADNIQGAAGPYALESNFGAWTFEFGASGWRIVG